MTRSQLSHLSAAPARVRALSGADWGIGVGDSPMCRVLHLSRGIVVPH